MILNNNAKYDYPLLNKVFNFFSKKTLDLNNTYLVCCQHLLEPQLEMFKKFIDFGFKPENIFLVGKAYSANNEIADELRLLGINIFNPKFTGQSFDIEHRKNCISLINSLPVDKENIIVLDDGGELISLFVENHKKILFAVEQTSSGFRKLESANFNFPIINVARTTTKLTQESPFIARLCFERISEYLKYKKINEPNILIVGLGPIGQAIFDRFRQHNFDIFGFDIKDEHTELISFILDKRPDVVIGATGINILSKDDVDKIIFDKNLYLISVSSGDREFPVSFFRTGDDVYQDVVYRNIIFVNNGFPITFKGNRNESMPVEIEKTICLLFGSVVDGTVNGVGGSGFVNISADLEKIINN